jgi:surface antigen
MKNSMTKSVFTSGLIALALSSSVLLSGCGGASNEQTNTIVGSVLGGAVGRQFGKGSGKDVMTVVGAVVGGMIGGNMGRRMDNNDQRRVNNTLETAPNYKKVAWDNQNTNTQYEFTPVNKYEGNVNGQRTQCRDYVMDAWIDGRMQQVKGRACKNHQGQWVNAS